MNPLSASAFAIAIVFCLGSSAHATPPDTDAVDAWLAEQRTEGKLVSATVAFVDGARVESRGVGTRAAATDEEVDADTTYQIGSITKVFTHLLLAELVAQGKLGYDTELGTLLPSSLEPRNAGVPKITLEALATHRSGLPRLPANLDLSNTIDPYAGYDVAALHAGVVGTRDKQPLGDFYTYSNFGVGLLGHVLGRAAGTGYRDALAEHVIAPLGLQQTAFEPGPEAARPFSEGKPVTPWSFDDALAGAGALWGSVGDLARLVQAYTGTHEHALQHELALDLEIIAPAGDFEITRVWHVARAGGAPVYWHNGGTAGFHSFVGFRTDRRQGVAILVSGDADPTTIGLRALGVQPIESKPEPMDASIFGQYPLGPQFGIGVFQSDGVLVAQATGQPAFALHRVNDDWYALGEVDASLHFLREAAKVTGLELAQGGKLQRAPRAADIATAAARKETKLSAEALAAYVGEYDFAPGVVLSVRQGRDTLEARLTGQPYFSIFPRGEDRFFYKVVDAELQFERDANGKLGAVVLHQGGIEQRATRSE